MIGEGQQINFCEPPPLCGDSMQDSCRPHLMIEIYLIQGLKYEISEFVDPDASVSYSDANTFGYGHTEPKEEIDMKRVSRAYIQSNNTSSLQFPFHYIS